MSIDVIADAGSPRDHASRRRVRPGDTVRAGDKVFVSHTSEMAAWPEGRSYVDAALDAIRASGLVGVDMRDFPPADLPPVEVCRQRVLGAQVYVGIIGFTYGSRVPGSEFSYTETEFDIATEAGLPRLVVLRRATAGAVIHPDQERFRRKVTENSGLTVAFFDDVGELQLHLERGLRHLLDGHHRWETTGPGWVMAGPEGSEGVRGHIERRGHGQRSVARGGDLFRGRDEALAVITGWLEAKTAPERVLVVTGQPGAGKSAVVARAVLTLEKPAVAQGRRLGLVFHARAATLAHLLSAVATVTGTEVADSVPGMVARVRDVPPPDGAWRLVADALDEAATDGDRARMVEALTELAALGWRVVVATRPLSPDEQSRYAPGALLPALGVRSAADQNLIDLDTDRFFDPAGLVAFTSAVLRQEGVTRPGPPDGAWRAYRTDPQLCERLAAVIARRAGRNHLVAALAADPLSQASTVTDPDAPGFTEASLPTSVGEALGKYLDRLPPAEQARVRGLLTALAYARGSGVGDDLWLGFAGALGLPATAADLDALLQDPTFPTVADLARLLPLLPAAPPPGSAPLVAVLRTAAPRAGDLPPPRRAWLLALTAAHLGQPELTRRFHRPDTPAVVWAHGRGAAHQTLVGHTDVVSAVALGRAAGRAIIATAGDDRTVRIWDATIGQPLATLTGHAREVTAVALGHAGKRAIITTASTDRTVRIWDATTGQPLATLTGHTGWVDAVALGHAGGRLIVASTSTDRTVRIWDATTGQPLATLTGHADWVRTVAVGHAGGRAIVATTSDDRTVRIWDATTGAELAILDVLDRPSGLAIGSDRLVIAAGNAVIAARLPEAWATGA